MQYRRFENPQVNNAFAALPKRIKNSLLLIRELIFQIADTTDEIGTITEILKWDTPSYLTHNPKSGTTIRLSKIRARDDKYAISVHCQTSLIADFKAIYPQLNYDGNRSILLETDSEMPRKTIQHFIHSALTYHYRKKRGIGI